MTGELHNLLVNEDNILDKHMCQITLRVHNVEETGVPLKGISY